MKTELQGLHHLSRFTLPPGCHLSLPARRRMLGDVNGKWSKWLPYLFMLMAALSRWPGLFPPNFSAFYALAFCAGAFFPRNIKWWLPLGTLVVTDIVLDFYYYFALGINRSARCNWSITRLRGHDHPVRHAVQSSLAFPGAAGGRHYGGHSVLSRHQHRRMAVQPFGNPEYTKDLAGWLIALTKGTRGYPTTLEFFWQHAAERRPVHRPVRRRAEAERGRRIGEREGDEEEPAEAPEGEEVPGGREGVMRET